MSTEPTSETLAYRDDLTRINLNAAGIDVGAREMYVAVPADRSATPVRCFGTYTADLHQIANWLNDSGITSVAMESTGVYWIPLWEILKGYGIDVILVDARRNQLEKRKNSCTSVHAMSRSAKAEIAACRCPQRTARVGVQRAYSRVDDSAESNREPPPTNIV